MALVATNLSAEPRSFSIGPLKVQLITFTVASGDTSGTITCDALSSIVLAVPTTIEQTAAATYSGNVVTLSFANPGATRHGQLLVLGR